jgi:subtilisin-like proprotein convertase family protein
MNKFFIIFFVLFFPNFLFAFDRSDSKNDSGPIVIRRFTPEFSKISNLKLNGNLNSFTNNYGKDWEVYWYNKTNTPHVVQGKGISLFNSALMSYSPLPEVIEKLEKISSDFAEKNAFLFKIKKNDLKLNKKLSICQNDLCSIHFYQYYKKIPVEKTDVYFTYKFGKLIQFGVDTFTNINISTDPIITRPLDIAKEIVKYVDSDSILDNGTLVVYPRLNKDSFDFILAYKIVILKSDVVNKITLYIDANSGKVLEKYGSILTLTGELSGLVHPRLYTEPYQKYTFENAYVRYNENQNFITDSNGKFALDANPIELIQTDFNGQFFKVRNDSGNNATNKIDVNSRSYIDLSWDDTNSTPAERDTFYHLNKVRDWAMKYIDVSWFNETVRANVNIAKSCNAFWDGFSVNFFQANEECGNTGEIADVVYHEWGHGLDENTGGIVDSSYSEGIGDVVAFHLTDDYILGPYFRKDGTPVREIETDYIYPEYGGIEHEVHEEGMIFGSTWWDLRKYLIKKLGQNRGQNLSSELFLKHLSLTQQYTDAYNSILAIDDDNGNLADHTPNFITINRAFAEHGLAKFYNPLEFTNSEILDENNDGIFSPNENITFKTDLKNNDSVGFSNIRISLDEIPQGVYPTNKSVFVRDLSPGENMRVDALAFRIDKGLCKKEIKLGFGIETTTLEPLIRNFSIVVGLKPLKDQMLTFQNNEGGSIPDKNKEGLTSRINIAQNLTIYDLEIELNIAHMYVGDLFVRLISPFGKKYTLFNPKSTYSKKDLNKTVKVKAYGESLNGTWQLKVFDKESGDTGQLNSWKIKAIPAEVNCGL